MADLNRELALTALVSAPRRSLADVIVPVCGTGVTVDALLPRNWKVPHAARGSAPGDCGDGERPPQAGGASLGPKGVWRIDALRHVPAAVRLLSLETPISPLPELDGRTWDQMPVAQARWVPAEAAAK